MLIWIRGGHLFSGILAAASLLFLLYTELQEKDNYYTIQPISPSLIGIPMRAGEGEKPIKQWTGVSQEFWAVGLSVHLPETNNFFLRAIAEEYLRYMRFKYPFILYSRISIVLTSLRI